MAKYVNFEGKKTGLDRDIKIKDTHGNVKKVAQGMRNIFDAMAKIEKSKGDQLTLMDYSDAIDEQVIKGIVDLLELNEADAKKMDENASYSDLEHLYNQAADEFLSMQVPTTKTIQDQVNKLNQQAVASTEASPKGGKKQSAK